MKRINKMKKLRRVAALFTVMALVLTGCGKTTGVDDIVQDIGNIDDEKSNTGQTLSDMLKVNEEKWIEEFEVSGENLHTVKIAARVKVPDVTGMSVLTLEEQKFDAEGKKVLLEAVCTEGEIYSFGDSKMPKWFYEQQIESTMEQIEDMLAARENDTNLCVNGSWGSWDEQELKETQQYLDKLQQSYEEAPENGYDVGDYSADNYTGMTDTGRVTMYFRPDENIVSWSVSGDFSQKADLTSDSEISLLIGEIDYGNLCKMSEEEAKNYAISFAAKIGYEEYVASDIKYLTWQNYSSENWEQWTDGYVVTLAREVDGVPVDYTNIGSSNGYWQQGVGEYIQLQFNDAGVMNGYIYKPRKLKAVDTKDTQLLPYEKVKDIMKSLLVEKAKDYGKEIDVETVDFLIFSNMELIYYTMKDEEQGIVVVPVWRLSSVESEEATGHKIAMHPLVINAIDGSWIDVWQGI